MGTHGSKATIAFLQYAARQEKNGTGELPNLSFRAVGSLVFLLIPYWIPTTAPRCSEVLPVSFKYATLAAFKYGRQFARHASDISGMMQPWMEAASAVPYTDDVCGSVVVGLLNMASSDELSSHIPLVAWNWLNKRPVLPPEFVAPLSWATESAVQTIHRLGGVELIASYLHIIWSEERVPWDKDILAMGRLIREELGGIEAAGYRTDLIRRLDHVLLRLDQSQGEWWAKKVYEELRRELLEVDEKAMKILTGTSSSCHPFFVY